MSDFKSIIIPEKIQIVENAHGQGYVVPKGNDNVLQSAMSWAKSFVYGEGENWSEKEKNGQWKEGIVHEYENGNFKLKLKAAADYSNNSGKLSFWNCIIEAPDGEEFLIGINSYILCELLKTCTLVKGEVVEPIYLGREKANVGAYIEEMEDFKQAEREKAQRELAKIKTTKYEIGDVVGNLTTKWVYCGTVYEHWEANARWGGYYTKDGKEKKLLLSLQ